MNLTSTGKLQLHGESCMWKRRTHNGFTERLKVGEWDGQAFTPKRPRGRSPRNLGQVQEQFRRILEAK
jgi:hypothetical protein